MLVNTLDFYNKNVVNLNIPVAPFIRVNVSLICGN